MHERKTIKVCKWHVPPSLDVLARIKQYLSTGGLFNPELADHDAVRDLLIDCRDVISAFQKRDGKYSTPSLPLTPNSRL